MRTTIDKPFALVEKQHLEPRKPKLLLTLTVEGCQKFLGSLKGTQYAIDFEACGAADGSALNVWDRRTQVVGTSIAGKEGCFYINHVNGADPRTHSVVLAWAKDKQLVAHNVAYDGKLILRDTGTWYNFVMCTYGMFRQLVQDRDPKYFSWSLDSLETEILGWPESHKDRLGELLEEHSLPKAEMAKLAWIEPEEFAHYGALDAEAAWQAFCYFRSVLQKNKELWGARLAQYHTQEFLTLCRLLAEQNLRGMYIDRPALLDYKKDSEKRIKAYRKQLLGRSELQPWIQRECNKAAKKLLGPEPPKYVKSGTRTTKRWDNWNQKLSSVIRPEDAVNFNSKDQLADLFFGTKDEGGLAYHPIKDGAGFAEKTPWKGHEPHKRPVIDKNVLPNLGEIGKLLFKHNRLVKNLGYVNSLAALSESSIFHADFNPIGTISGRPSGGRGQA